MRILAIDYGQKRTGIAVTDPLQIIAGPLTTVDTRDLLAFIDDYIGREQVERIVVGYPRRLDGSDSENMRRITPFVNRLRKIYPSVQVDLFDERFTSVIAHKAIIDSGIPRKARQDKALVDKISAAIILEEYMAAQKL
ncbi:MAG: Holliday junction resolvase RuvX [Bacteroidaceae bacterium]|nr:Holliday junction resolvase RuvX [Bacteroidaceae bacterium]MBQ9177230.1 Holliday junction resolvase RuvX [Bacteroidaceae bacterium]MBR1377705.1 Holliday junction resolvase RuvX [Bacteroidaceae bacterium]